MGLITLTLKNGDRVLGAPFAVWLTCVIASGTIGGCSGDDNRRNALTGIVLLDGQPVAIGEIRFLPSGGTSGPAASAKISRGSFAFTTSNGPLLGEHLVHLILPPIIKEDGEDQEPRSREPRTQPTNKAELSQSSRPDTKTASRHAGQKTRRVLVQRGVTLNENESFLTLEFQSKSTR